METPSQMRPRATRDLWLEAACDLFSRGGIEAVKVMPLAKKLGLTRTGFYWHFRDLDDLHSAIILHWEKRNTDIIIARCSAPAQSLTEALFNLIDCWIDPDLFDSSLDLEIRSWSRYNMELRDKVRASDQARIQSVKNLFLRYELPGLAAQSRALTVILTQTGYISMAVTETRAERAKRAPDYVEIFAGIPPRRTEVEAFLSRHR